MQEELRPYFSLPKVMDGLFSLAKMLFDINVEPADGEAPVVSMKRHHLSHLLVNVRVNFNGCHFLLLFRFGTKMSDFFVSKIHQETQLHTSILILTLGLLKNVVGHGWMKWWAEVVSLHVMVHLLGCLLPTWFAIKRPQLGTSPALWRSVRYMLLAWILLV